MRLNKLFFLLCLGVFVACDDTDSGDEINIQPKHVQEETNIISTDFTTNNFESNVEEELLKEIKICDPNATDEENPDQPACSPKFFRFFKLSPKIPMKDGFIVLAKAGVGGVALRRVLIFQREKGVLVKLNGFIGNLVEQRKSNTEFDDLVIRFSDRVDDHLAYYNCLFTWNGGKYEYVNCELIDEDGPRRIKAEYMDSMAVEIKKILDKNQMIF